MIDFRNVDQWNIGNDEVIRAYLNNTLVWEKYHFDYTEPFYLKVISSPYSQWANVRFYKSNSNAPDIYIQYSYNKVDWNTIGKPSESGLTFEAPVDRKIYLRSSAPLGNLYGYNWISFPYKSPANSDGVEIEIGGNIMSLYNGYSFTGNETTITQPQAFMGVFRGNGLYSAENLLLPATTLSSNCYKHMFSADQYLYNPPVMLPATVLTQGCYGHMFDGCTRLSGTPLICAQTLASNCYEYMFRDCVLLRNAPILRVSTLADECYSHMFDGCSNLVYITCLATDISATDCTNKWLDGVSSLGVFTKAASMSSWPSGDSGIPTNWTVQDAA